MLFRIFEYLQYRWHAKNAHGIHSPFVFDFYNKVLKEDLRLPDLEVEITNRYLNNKENIQYQDPKTGGTKSTDIQSLAKRTWSGKSFSYFLIKLCEWLKVSTFLETGTALGITFSMVSHAKGIKKVYSIEGSPTLAKIARQLSLKPKGIESSIIHGEVRTTFGKTLEETSPEIVFLDADHRSGTIRFYMDEINKRKQSIKVIVIHDIYWSKDMKSAWLNIVDNTEYNCTVDCYHAGIVFLHLDMEKQHFVLKY